jgi:hypothetical protein
MRKNKKKRKEQPTPDRPSALDWTFGPNIPTCDFIKDYHLGQIWGLQEAVENFIDKMEKNDFLAWEAVMSQEQGLPLTAAQRATLDDLLGFGDSENEPILYIDGIERPNEPWYVILNKIVPHLLVEPLRTTDVPYEVQSEGWRRLVRCLNEYAGGLSLPLGVASPEEVVPVELRHKLWLQDCFDTLSGLGQDEELTLEDSEQHYRIDEFIEGLRRHKETVAYFGLTLDSLLTKVILPEKDRLIFIQVMQDKLGMKFTSDRIADYL